MEDADCNDVRTSATASEVYEIIRLVRPLFRHLYRSVENALEGTGITIPMRGVLETLEVGGPRTVPQIARTLMVQRQFIQLTVNALVEQGWIEPIANRAHKRSPLLRLTPAGTATFGAVKAREAATIGRLADKLEQADVETCRKILARLTDYFAVVAEQGTLPEENTP